MYPLLQRAWLAGAVLLLAGCSEAVRWERPTTGASPSMTTRASAPRAGARPPFHIVRAGETLYGISFRYQLSPSDLAAWNGLGDGTLILPGQRLRLSGPARPATAAADGPGGDIVAPPRWQRPVSGPVLSRFGESPLTASGIQLGGQTGDLVRAAAGGRVVYAGNGLPGYGELLIVKHNSEWLSAYGYNEALLVREGDSVQAGQPIARMGQGPLPGMAVRRSLLHFEVRRNGVPVDPLGLLPPAGP